MLKSFLSRHESGLYVVAGSESPAAGDAVTAQQVARLIDTLRQEFRYVVVDTAPGLSDHTLAALERATDLVLMSSMDVPGVRGLRKELDVLHELYLMPGRPAPGAQLRRHRRWPALADVEATMGSALDVVLPRSSSVPLSTNTGRAAAAWPGPAGTRSPAGCRRWSTASCPSPPPPPAACSADCGPVPGEAR